jgi:hypothetical protein
MNADVGEAFPKGTQIKGEGIGAIFLMNHKGTLATEEREKSRECNLAE